MNFGDPAIILGGEKLCAPGSKQAQAVGTARLSYQVFHSETLPKSIKPYEMHPGSCFLLQIQHPDEKSARNDFRIDFKSKFLIWSLLE